MMWLQRRPTIWEGYLPRFESGLPENFAFGQFFGLTVVVSVTLLAIDDRPSQAIAGQLRWLAHKGFRDYIDCPSACLQGILKGVDSSAIHVCQVPCADDIGESAIRNT